MIEEKSVIDRSIGKRARPTEEVSAFGSSSSVSRVKTTAIVFGYFCEFLLFHLVVVGKRFPTLDLLASTLDA